MVKLEKCVRRFVKTAFRLSIVKRTAIAVGVVAVNWSQGEPSPLI